MVTWWKQPGGKTMKRETRNSQDHISVDHARFEIALFAKNGYEIIDYENKITAIKIKQ